MPDYVMNYYAAYRERDGMVFRYPIDNEIYIEMIEARGLNRGDRLNVTEQEYAVILLRSK